MALKAALIASTIGFFAILPLANAMDSTDVLPPKINSPALRVGRVDGIGQRYNGQGQLESLNDINSVQFDAHQIAKIEPQVNELVKVLNQFGNQRLGDQLYLGTLHVNTAPEVTYLAPVHAYGVTSKWTVALGVPILHYKNKLSLTESGSNVGAIQQRVGTQSTQINDAFKRLNVSLVGSAQAELAQKGYKPLNDRDQTMFGDVQLASIYQFYKTPEWSAVFRALIELPTGQAPDPDDLADLGIFGETAIEPALIGSYYVGRGLSLGSSLYIHAPLPDKLTRRVPLDDDDVLPDRSGKRNLNRQLGMSGGWDLSATFAFTSEFQFQLGYEFFSRAADRYSGTSYGDLGRLSSETNELAERVHANISFSSVTAYTQHRALLPAIVSIDVSDTVRGTNVERRLIQELWCTMFF